MNSVPSCFTGLALLLCMLFISPVHGQWSPVSLEGREADLVALDDWVEGGILPGTMGESGLSARHDLLVAMSKEGEVSALEWALAVHGWLRSAEDAHLRVRFDQMTPRRNLPCSLTDAELLNGDNPWAAYGPGLALPACARAAWLRRTWPWLSVLEGRDDVQGAVECSVSAASIGGVGMTVEDHGAFFRWVIPSFGAGDARRFSKDFRRCRRQLRRANKPVMLDLTGNLGGFRSRRHAVLGVFLDPSLWPEEREAQWGDSLVGEEVVPAMPLVRSSRVMESPLVVMLDGLSFSASLLLADALKAAGRAEIFGCAPLGRMGGCSGSPKTRTLPGSGLKVDIPTRKTRMMEVVSGPYLLSENLLCGTGTAEWNDAVRWLLSSDLAPRR